MARREQEPLQRHNGGGSGDLQEVLEPATQFPRIPLLGSLVNRKSGYEKSCPASGSELIL